jgi:hypothetical protein
MLLFSLVGQIERRELREAGDRMDALRVKRIHPGDADTTDIAWISRAA